MTPRRANYPDLARIERDRVSTKLALAAIWAVLNCNGIAGWNDWYQHATDGEWN
ncbi:MAG: hypothetical protein PS018_11540 [bacterium]|nr:hypothetical protein [bacterium]